MRKGLKLNVEIYYKARLIWTMWYGCKTRQTIQSNKNRKFKTDAGIFKNLTYNSYVI